MLPPVGQGGYDQNGYDQNGYGNGGDEAPRSRRRDDQPRKSNTSWIILAVAAVLVLVGSFFVANAMFKGGGGGKQVAAPALTGKSFDDATSAAHNTGSKLTVVKGDPMTCNQPKDMVCQQAPAAGTQMSDSGTITVNLSSGPGQTAVPDETNQPLTAATSALQAAGFTLGTTVYVNSDTVQQDSVISQTPAPGTKADAGATVTLTVSQGSGKSSVPSVVGQPVDQATAALQAAGFTVDASKTTPSTNASQVVGTVASQTPAKAAKGATISLTVYGAPAKVTVPILVGKTYKDAFAALGQAGLKSSTVVAGPQDDNAMVTAVNPPAGSQVDPTQVIQLTTMPGNGKGGPPTIPGLPSIGGNN
jgi:serine/threonine-protein kinase